MSNVFILLFCLLSKKAFFIRIFGIPTLLLLLLATIIRMLLPIEPPFAKVIMSTTLLPRIYSIFSSPLFANVTSINLLSIIGILWISGTLIQILKLIRNYYGLRKSLKFCPAKMDIEQSTFFRVTSVHNLPKHLRIVETSAVSTPMILGFFNPIIIFPMLNFTTEEQYFILLHELEHYRNKDIWIKAFIELLCALYWWNPLVYTLRERTDRILEINVDLSISSTWEEVERLRYLKFLLNTYKRSRLLTYKKTMCGALSIADDDQATMVQRFEILFSHDESRCSKTKIFMIGMVSILMLIISFSYIVQPQYSLPTDCNSDIYAITSDNAYLVKRPDGQYDVYIHNVGYFTTIQDIEEPYTKLSVKNESEEENEKYKNSIH